jgi:hypothetical protein
MVMLKHTLALSRAMYLGCDRDGVDSHGSTQDSEPMQNVVYVAPSLYNVMSSLVSSCELLNELFEWQLSRAKYRKAE